MQECCGAFSTKLADVCGVLCGYAETRAKEDYPGMEKFGLNYIGVVCMYYIVYLCTMKAYMLLHVTK